jgi:hypothetical protein
MKLMTTTVELDYEVNERTLSIQIFDDKALFINYRGKRIRLTENDIQDDYIFLKGEIEQLGCFISRVDARELLMKIEYYWG